MCEDLAPFPFLCWQVVRRLEEPIEAFLADIGLGRYRELFTEKGYAFVSDVDLAPSEELARLLQGEPEQRRLRDAINSLRRTIRCDEPTVEVLFTEWMLSGYTEMFGAEGYALVSDLLNATEQQLERLTSKMKPAEKSRLERTLAGCRR